MKSPLRHALLCCAALAGTAEADEGGKVAEGRFEVSLDLDRDGVLDQAIVWQDPATGRADLSIYLGTGSAPHDPARAPSYVKHDFADNLVLSLSPRGKHALSVTFGCGGCSDDTSTTLTIVYRHGAFWLAGVTYDWDTRTAAGECDIDLLTGRATLHKGVDGKARPIGRHYASMKLDDWSEDHRPDACGQKF